MRTYLHNARTAHGGPSVPRTVRAIRSSCSMPICSQVPVEYAGNTTVTELTEYPDSMEDERGIEERGVS